MQSDPPEGANCDRVAEVVPADNGSGEAWLVRGADGVRSNHVQRFTGTDALMRSLRYAHEEYARVRWLVN